LLYLDGTLFCDAYISLRIPRFEMTLREYIRESRNPTELNEILIGAIKGVRELHLMGYVHRDLKPDNIMLSFKPLRVVVIDFNRAVRKENIK